MYNTIKNETIKEKNIVKTSDNYYRFVNHNNYLLTSGFKSRLSLLKYKNDLKFDNKTILKMKERYKKLATIKCYENLIK
jgi:hypothetical protein